MMRIKQVVERRGKPQKMNFTGGVGDAGRSLY
jgi:hypothetical protein